MKKMIFIKSVLLFCILGMSAIPALAAEQDQKLNYIKVNFGIYNPTGNLDDNNYDNGGSYSVSYGRYLTKYLSVEGGVNSFANDIELTGSNITAGTYDQDNVIFGHSLEFTLKGEYPAGPVRLYAGAGFGLCFVNLITDIDSSTLGNFDKYESDFVVSGHLVTGIDYDINDHWFVNLEGKYRITDDVDINKTVASIPVAYNGDLDGYSVTVGFGFRF